MKAIFIINNSNSFIILLYNFFNFCAHPDNEQIKTQFIYFDFIIKLYLGDNKKLCNDVKSSFIVRK